MGDGGELAEKGYWKDYEVRMRVCRQMNVSSPRGEWGDARNLTDESHRRKRTSNHLSRLYSTEHASSWCVDLLTLFIPTTTRSLSTQQVSNSSFLSLDFYKEYRPSITLQAAAVILHIPNHHIRLIPPQ